MRCQSTAAAGNDWEPYSRHVYIGDLCKIHDAAYTVGGSEEDRASADSDFSNGIDMRIYNKLLVIGGGPKALAQVKRKAYLGSRIYWLGVHYGGSKQFNYKE